MASDKSSPLSGILMTTLFGTISIIIAAITMWQVHSIWVKYHHSRQPNEDASTDIEVQNSACEPTTEEWQQTPSTSLDAVDQAYSPPRRDQFLPSDAITAQRSAFDEERSDPGLVVVSRFSEDSSDGGWGDGIEAPPTTPESVTEGSIEEI